MYIIIDETMRHTSPDPAAAWKEVGETARVGQQVLKARQLTGHGEAKSLYADAFSHVRMSNPAKPT